MQALPKFGSLDYHVEIDFSGSIHSGLGAVTLHLSSDDKRNGWVARNRGEEEGKQGGPALKTFSERQ